MSGHNVEKKGLLEWIAAGLLVVMSSLVLLEVLCRYILNASLPWSEELCRYLFIWMSFIGAGIATRRGAHISVDSLTSRLTRRTQLWLEAVVGMFTIVFMMLLLYQSLLALPSMIGQESITMGFSMAWVFAAMPAGALIIIWMQARVLSATKMSPAMIVVTLVIVALLCAAFVMAGSAIRFSPRALVLILVLVLFVLILINTSIAVSVGLSCVAYLLLKGDISMVVFPLRMIGGVDSFLLLAIPLFILAGELMNTGGITERLVSFAKAIVGHIRGSLGMATVLAEYFFSGMSGSSVADVSAIGALLIPSMKEAGYRPETAVSIVSASSAMGMLVPPCIPMVVLASLTNLSVAALFMAGFLPAACMALLLLALIYVNARREGIRVESRQSAIDMLRAFKRGFLPLMTPVIILGGILLGIVTPTEAAVIAVVYAAVLGMFVYREIRRCDVVPILVRTVVMSGMVMLLVCTASMISWIFSAEGIPGLIAKAMLKFSTNPAPFLLLSIIVFLIFGSILEGMPAVIVLAPIFFPVVGRFGIDPLHYGTLIIAALGVGLFLPPFGVGFFISCVLGKVNVEQAARTYIPYFLMLLAGILVIAFVPWLSLVVPRLLNL